MSAYYAEAAHYSASVRSLQHKALPAHHANSAAFNFAARAPSAKLPFGHPAPFAARHAHQYDAAQSMGHAQYHQPYPAHGQWTDASMNSAYAHNGAAPLPSVAAGYRLPQANVHAPHQPYYYDHNSYHHTEPGHAQYGSMHGYGLSGAEEAMAVGKRPMVKNVHAQGRGATSTPNSAHAFSDHGSHTPKSNSYGDGRPASAETVSSDPLPMTPPRPVMYTQQAGARALAHPTAHETRAQHGAALQRMHSAYSPAQDPTNATSYKPARINPDINAQYVTFTGQEISFCATAVNADRAPVLASAGSPGLIIGKGARSGSEGSSRSNSTGKQSPPFGAMDGGDVGALGIGSGYGMHHGHGHGMGGQGGMQHATSDDPNNNGVISMDQLARMMQDVASIMHTDAGLGLGNVRPPRHAAVTGNAAHASGRKARHANKHAH